MTQIQRLARRYPELLLFPTERDAHQARQDWGWALMRRPRFWAILFPAAIGLGITVHVVGGAIRQYLPLSPALHGGLVGGVVGGTCGSAITWAWRREFRRHLRKCLVAHGVPVCIPCGYDLRGQTEPRCPECGAAFDASLLGGHPRRGLDAPSSERAVAD